MPTTHTPSFDAQPALGISAVKALMPVNDKTAQSAKKAGASKIPNVRTRALGMHADERLNVRLPRALKEALILKTKRAKTTPSEVVVWAIAHYLSGDAAPRALPGVGHRVRSAALLELVRRQSAILWLVDDLGRFAVAHPDAPLAVAGCASLLTEIKQLSEQSFRRLLRLNHAAKL